MGSKGEEGYKAWTTAVEAQFNITYWQYLQTEKTRACVEAVVSTSLINLIKEQSIRLVGGFISAIALIAFHLL